ncbi:hypothetical protein J7J47_03675 [Halomonas sp. ISL-60]|uniref:hypothetical protein n=1 Tax=Halomonas sp. ISL-56 TaxID=2819149 RepID=UPI001BEB85C2|nr:hypothetical protein [Halomonas sp. ISL-56]MBT2771329.1 hypothetical protein [Halomonas sp. ISL-60]MBT2800686.1 hypothetical protein [Halomonas sp. ISL-56]
MIKNILGSYKWMGVIALVSAIAIQEFRINSFRDDIREQQQEHQEQIIKQQEIRYNRIEKDFQDYIENIKVLNESQQQMKESINIIERNASREAETISKWNLQDLIKKDIDHAQALIDEHQRSLNESFDK